MIPRLEQDCPNCNSRELFDATVTTENPWRYERYDKFRGNKFHRVYCCFNCKAIVHFLKEEDGSLTMRNWLRPTRLPTPEQVDAF